MSGINPTLKEQILATMSVNEAQVLVQTLQLQKTTIEASIENFNSVISTFDAQRNAAIENLSNVNSSIEKFSILITTVNTSV